MILKAMILFLIGMGVLAMFGGLRLPKGRGPRLPTARRCAACGRPKISKDPCPCGKDKPGGD